MKTQALTLGFLGVLSLATAYANVNGQSSNQDYIQVGGTEWVEGNPSNGHTGELGSPGIGVHTSETPFSRVSLNRLEWLARFGLGGSHNLRTGVTKLQEDHWAMPKRHSDFGYYAFKKVRGGDADVYFGEWSDEGDFTDDSHTVYYVGKDKTSNMPSSGAATYTVQGINNVANNQLMNGQLNADFAKNTLVGSIANDSLNIGIDSTINASTASFSGSALATGASVSGGMATGEAKGEFFGNNAKALGGIAVFNDKAIDTAFAGTRGSITP